MELKAYLLLSLVMLSFLPVSSADVTGNETSGGGHGVVLENGDLVALDLLEAPADIKGVPINLFDDERTRDAARYASTRLSFIASAFPEFGMAAAKFYGEMKWHFTQQSLPAIADSGVVVPGMVQVAMQNENGEVTINEPLFSRLDTRNKGGLILHEVLLGKLGLRFPRSILRKVVFQAFSNKADWALVKSELDRIHPAIAKGERKLYIELETSDASPLTSCYDVYANGVSIYEFGCHLARSGQHRSKELNIPLTVRPPVSMEVAGFAGGRHTLKVYVNGILWLEKTFVSSGKPVDFDIEYLLPVR